MKAESHLHVLMAVSILIDVDNGKSFQQIGKNWHKIASLCDDLRFYLYNIISKDNSDFKSGISVKLWSSDMLLWVIV